MCYAKKLNIRTIPVFVLEGAQKRDNMNDIFTIFMSENIDICCETHNE